MRRLFGRRSESVGTVGTVGAAPAFWDILPAEEAPAAEAAVPVAEEPCPALEEPYPSFAAGRPYNPFRPDATPAPADDGPRHIGFAPAPWVPGGRTSEGVSLRLGYQPLHDGMPPVLPPLAGIQVPESDARRPDDMGGSSGHSSYQTAASHAQAERPPPDYVSAANLLATPVRLEEPEGRVSDVSERPLPNSTTVSPLSSRPPSPASIPTSASTADTTIKSAAPANTAAGKKREDRAVPCPDCRDHYDGVLQATAVDVEAMMFQSEEKDAEIRRLRRLVRGQESGATPGDAELREAGLRKREAAVTQMEVEQAAARRRREEMDRAEDIRRGAVEQRLEAALREREAEVERLQAERVERAVQEENERADRSAKFAAARRQLEGEIQALKAAAGAPGGAAEDQRAAHEAEKRALEKSLRDEMRKAMADLQATRTKEQEDFLVAKQQLIEDFERTKHQLTEDVERAEKKAAWQCSKLQERHDAQTSQLRADLEQQRDEARREAAGLVAALRKRDAEVQELKDCIERLRAQAQERVDKNLNGSPAPADALPDSEVLARWKQVAWKVRQCAEEHKAVRGAPLGPEEKKLLADLVNGGFLRRGPPSDQHYASSHVPARVARRLAETVIWTVLATWVFSSRARISCVSRAVGKGLGGSLVKLCELSPPFSFSPFLSTSRARTLLTLCETAEHILKDFKDAKAFHQWRMQTATLLRLEDAGHFADRAGRVVDEIKRRAEPLLNGWDGPLSAALLDVVGEAMRLDADMSRQRAWFCCYFPLIQQQPGQDAGAMDPKTMETDGAMGKHVVLLVRPLLTKTGNSRGENYEQVTVVDRSLVCCGG